MKEPPRRNFGIIGPLEAFPLRLAAREAERQGHHLTRGARRDSTHIVFGRRLLQSRDSDWIEQSFESFSSKDRTSESSFLHLLGLADMTPVGNLSRNAILGKSNLQEPDFELLNIFDCFGSSSEPYSFADLILARKYARLAEGGLTWHAIARSVHRPGKPDRLTSLNLVVGDADRILAELNANLAEIDGQYLLPIEFPANDADELFIQAEIAEENQNFKLACDFYSKCLTRDPGDAIIAFNLANCLAASGREDEAAVYFARAIKLEPNFAEAWANYAMTFRSKGQFEPAIRHLEKAIAVDNRFADAIYNLAALYFELGENENARKYWRDYLELDSDTQWADNARRAIKFIEIARRD